MGEKMTLLPCPFCGSPVELGEDVSYDYYSARDAQHDGMGVSAGSIRRVTYFIECRCGIRTESSNDAFLIARWNRRHLNQPAQAVDVEAILEVIAELRKNRDPLERELDQCADKLTAALPNANVKEGWGPKYTAVPCHCLTMAQREYCTNRFKCSTVTTQSTSPQPEE